MGHEKIIGILGVGHISKSMVTGFLNAGIRPENLLFSPRGLAADLSARHGVPIASDNADLVRRADIVFLAVRPADAVAVIAGLPWREDQIMISIGAGVPLSSLAVHPARVVRAMPLIASSFNASPTAYYPPLEEAREVLAYLGPAIAIDCEEQFEIATVSAAVFGWILDLIGQTVTWMEEKGADSAAMRTLVSYTVSAMGRLGAERPESIPTLLKQLCTPGGITANGLDVLHKGGQPAIWREACEAVLAQLSPALADNT